MIKKIIKKTLNYFNLKIVKVNIRKPLKHPYPVPTKEEIAAAQKELAKEHNLQINIPDINIGGAK